MSVLNLPEPSNWAKSGKLPLWAILGCLAIITYIAVLGTLAALRGNYLTTVLLFGVLTIPLLIMAMVLFGATGRISVRTTSDATGFTVWPDKRLGALYFTALVIAVPACLLFALFLPRGVLDIPISRGLQIFSPPLFIVAALIAVIGLVAGVRRGGFGHLKFTPAMIEIADVLRTRVLEWDDIIDVTDHSETKKAGRSVVLCLRDGGEEVVGGLNLYIPTGVPLYWMMRHYWKHPEDRMELVDSRAAERLRDGEFALD
ncbi:MULTISPECIES: PH domain-containing protein [unclassified Mycobacterium]|uniref:PH domain-containing protein n=1 Tax=unclassified Mycobacterium TaxID=2642494 RepID=UPI000AA6F480|nr:MULTISPECIES: PH domain-containing protein [unclassified Mycobacterium]